MRHGRQDRALNVFEALVEDDPRDGVAAVALAKVLLESGNATRALAILREADVPRSLDHAAAVLETRAMRMLGRMVEAKSRWNRYMKSRKGAARQWME